MKTRKLFRSNISRPIDLTRFLFVLVLRHRAHAIRALARTLKKIRMQGAGFAFEEARACILTLPRLLTVFNVRNPYAIGNVDPIDDLMALPRHLQSVSN